MQFEEFYRQVWPRLVGYFASKGASREDAEELSTEVLTRTANNWEELDSPLSWVWTVAKNVFTDWLRKKKRRPNSFSLVDELDRIKETKQEENIYLEALAECIEKLDSILCRVIRLSLAAFSYKKIAEEVGITESKVNHRLREAKKNLKDCIEATILDGVSK